MKKLLMLAFSNIRKTKASSAYLLMMFIIAGLLFNAGLLVLINFGGFFDKTAKELNASDTYYLISDNVYNEEVENFIYHHDNVLDIEKEANLWGLGYTVLDGEDAYNTYLINNISTKRELSKSKLIGESIPLKDNSIYLPVAYKINYDFKLHDEFIISFQNNEFKFFVGLYR